jgi:ankyrin repeat protein
MDDSEIVPRPPAKEFAYHRCVPKLLSLAITKASYEDIEKHVPASYLVYDYALAFKDEPEHTNPLEALKLNIVNERRSSLELKYIYAHQRNKKCLEHLLSHTDFTQEDLNEYLQTSKDSENLQAIQLLVRQNARGSFLDCWQEFPLHNAIVRHAFFGENFRFSPTDDPSVIAHYRTPLNLAAAYNLADVVKELAPFVSQEDKNVSLYIAASYGAEAVILPLIACGAEVNYKRYCENTALHEAVEHEHINITQLLITNGADVNKKNHFGFTPLHYSTSADLTSLLICHGASINAKNSDGYTPLHFAAMRNDVSQARVLLDCGALVDAEITLNRYSINLTEHRNSTALHLAATRGHIAIIRLLIARSANVQAKNYYDKTPCDLAQENIRDEKLRDTIISLLNSAQQKQ